MGGNVLAAVTSLIQRGVEPPHSTFGVLRLDAALDGGQRPGRGHVPRSKAVSSHRTPHLECCGSTQLWMGGNVLAAVTSLIQSGVEPPHSTFGVLRLDAALD